MRDGTDESVRYFTCDVPVHSKEEADGQAEQRNDVHVATGQIEEREEDDKEADEAQVHRPAHGRIEAWLEKRVKRRLQDRGRHGGQA